MLNTTNYFAIWTVNKKNHSLKWFATLDSISFLLCCQYCVFVVNGKCVNCKPSFIDKHLDVGALNFLSQIWTAATAMLMSIICQLFLMWVIFCEAQLNLIFPIGATLFSLCSSDDWSQWNCKLVRNTCWLVRRKMASQNI